MEEKENMFLGRGWAFPPAFDDERCTVQMVEAIEDIQQSLIIIINTIPGERIMLPEFGCGIREYVFETNDPTYMRMLKDAVYDALLYNEPRIKDIQVTLDPVAIADHPQRAGYIYIRIEYTVITTNTRNNMVIPYYKEEGTNI